MLEKLTIKNEHKEKNSFHCSDFGKSSLDIILSLRNTPKTNPPSWYDRLRMGAGNGAEAVLLQVLKDSGIVQEDYDQKVHGRVEFCIPGTDIPVTGYMDAVGLDEAPWEIKTINNKNAWDIKTYQENKPRTNYVGQLALYCYFKQKNGHLFPCTIDGLNRFLYECKKLDGFKYQCGDVIVDLKEEFDRWSRLWKIAKESDEIPHDILWEHPYKIPVEEIDWANVSDGDISKARNGHKVIGSWEVLYSPYKDLIIKLQGAELGYSPEELQIIKDKTAGYTSKKKINI